MTSVDSHHIRISQMAQHIGEEVVLKGWLYNARSSGKIQFLVVRDGTGLCQGILEKASVSAELFDEVKHLGRESSIMVTGTVREEPRSVGGFELAVRDVQIVHAATDYPITPKHHGADFLLKRRHLHLRSRKQWALARIRHTVVDAIRRFFNDRGFILIDTPIFAPSAGEGEQTLFEVDYFGSPVYLAQTGQLYLEAAALSHGQVYCFGPTFRAEKSKTRRHLTEFWMVEPEVAYIDLDGLLELAEQFVTAVTQAVLRQNRAELELFERDLAQLEKIQPPFIRLSYSDAVDLLHSQQVKEFLDEQLQSRKQLAAQLEQDIANWTEQQADAKKQWQKDKLAGQINDGREQFAELTEQISNIPHHGELAADFRWGKDLGGSDETIISQLHDRPVFVHRYPKECKAFYMKPDPAEPSTVLNFDCLAPQGYGEIIGGSMREDDYDALLGRIREFGYNEDDYQWYLDLRRFGSVPHGGFGLGVERTTAWLAGIKHIRETIAYPRMMGKIYP